VSEWARLLGMRRLALAHRLSRGWSTERALTEPVHHFRR
jgi:hypothetical protein